MRIIVPTRSTSSVRAEGKPSSLEEFVFECVKDQGGSILLLKSTNGKIVDKLNIVGLQKYGAISSIEAVDYLYPSQYGLIDGHWGLGPQNTRVETGRVIVMKAAKASQYYDANRREVIPRASVINLPE